MFPLLSAWTRCWRKQQNGRWFETSWRSYGVIVEQCYKMRFRYHKWLLLQLERFCIYFTLSQDLLSKLPSGRWSVHTNMYIYILLLLSYSRNYYNFTIVILYINMDAIWLKGIEGSRERVIHLQNSVIAGPGQWGMRDPRDCVHIQHMDLALGHDELKNHINIERHTALTIVSWPNPKQWIMVHTSDLMMISRQIIYILSVITREMGKLKTHSPTYYILDIWENILDLTQTLDEIYLTGIFKFNVFDKFAKWC